MKRIKMSIMALVLVTIMLSMSTLSFAGTTQNWDEAKALYNLNIMNGTSTTSFVPNLTVNLNRTEGVMLVVNMFGKNHEVHDMTEAEVTAELSRFSDRADIPDWGRDEVAWAVKTKMIKGTNATEFSPLRELSGAAYCTMILRDMGFPRNATNWRGSVNVLQQNGANNVLQYNKTSLLRDDAVGITLKSLNATFSPAYRNQNLQGETLVQALIWKGMFSVRTARTELRGLRTNIVFGALTE